MKQARVLYGQGQYDQSLTYLTELPESRHALGRVEQRIGVVQRLRLNQPSATDSHEHLTCSLDPRNLHQGNRRRQALSYSLNDKVLHETSCLCFFRQISTI